MSKHKAILLRLDEDKLKQFHSRYPWHGSFVHFVRQCLDEFLQQTDGAPTPNDTVSDVVKTVVSKEY